MLLVAILSVGQANQNLREVASRDFGRAGILAGIRYFVGSELAQDKLPPDFSRQTQKMHCKI
jgi:hypothetical protein